MPGTIIASLDVKQKVEYISVESLLPQVVILIPLIMKAPVTSTQRRAAAVTVRYGPFLVLDVASKNYQ